jgi:hypothetical protein
MTGQSEVVSTHGFSSDIFVTECTMMPFRKFFFQKDASLDGVPVPFLYSIGFTG